MPHEPFASSRDLGTFPDHALMTGDSAIDVRAARAAGLAVIVVGFGYSAAARSLGADTVVERLDQLPAVIAELPPDSCGLQSPCDGAGPGFQAPQV